MIHTRLPTTLAIVCQKASPPCVRAAAEVFGDACALRAVIYLEVCNG